MRHLSLLFTFALIAGASFRGNTQSLRNTAWKTYVASANDTLILHIGNDSSFVSGSNGDVVVRSVVHVIKDTLTLEDYEGQYMCPNLKGTYSYAIKDDKLIMKLITDDCDGRATGINGVAWIRVKP
jgi:hypothetical protein